MLFWHVRFLPIAMKRESCVVIRQEIPLVGLFERTQQSVVEKCRPNHLPKNVLISIILSLRIAAIRILRIAASSQAMYCCVCITYAQDRNCDIQAEAVMICGPLSAPTHTS